MRSSKLAELKPHITRSRQGFWICYTNRNSYIGAGLTPMDAWQYWIAGNQ